MLRTVRALRRLAEVAPDHLSQLEAEIAELSEQVCALRAAVEAGQPDGRPRWPSQLRSAVVFGAGLFLSALPIAYPEDNGRRNALALAGVGLALLLARYMELVSKRPRAMAVGVVGFLALVSSANVVGIALGPRLQFYAFPLVIGAGALAARALVTDRRSRVLLRIAGSLLVIGGVGNLLVAWLGGPSL